MARDTTFDATVAQYLATLDAAHAELQPLARVGVSGQNRDFGAALDAGRGAIAVLQATRGAVLRHNWNALLE
jgi:hypothetical protein